MSTYFVVYETGNASIIFVHFFAATFPHLIFLVEVTRPWHDSSNFGQIFREMTTVATFLLKKRIYKEYENIKIQKYSTDMDNGHRKRASFKNIPNNWRIWGDGPNKLWGVSSQTLDKFSVK